MIISFYFISLFLQEDILTDSESDTDDQVYHPERPSLQRVRVILRPPKTEPVAPTPKNDKNAAKSDPKKDAKKAEPVSHFLLFQPHFLSFQPHFLLF